MLPLDVYCEFITTCCPALNSPCCFVANQTITENFSISRFIVYNQSFDHTFNFNDPSENHKKSEIYCIHFFNCIIPKIPSGVMNIFENLTSLKMNNCGLKKIVKEDLIEFRKLFLLDVSDNDLEFIPRNLFNATPNLRIANFSNNKIKFISLDLFNNFPTFDKAYFAGNVKINENYDFRDTEFFNFEFKPKFKQICSIMALKVILERVPNIADIFNDVASKIMQENETIESSVYAENGNQQTINEKFEIRPSFVWEEMKRRNEELKRENFLLKRKNEEKNSENNDLKSENQRLKNERNELKHQIEKFRNNKLNLQIENSEIKLEFEELENLRRKVKKELEENKLKLNQPKITKVPFLCLAGEESSFCEIEEIVLNNFKDYPVKIILKIDKKIGNKFRHTRDIRKQIALNHIHQIPPSCSIIYTDASKNETQCGFAIFCPATSYKFNCKLKNHSSIFTAEMMAIKFALEYALEKRFIKPFILTDSLLSCKTIKNHSKFTYTTELINDVMKLLFLTDASIMWIPAHAGIEGNVVVDKLAKAGTMSGEIFHNKISQFDMKIILINGSKLWEQNYNEIEQGLKFEQIMPIVNN